MIELIGKPNIDFMGKRRYAFALSGFLVLLGIFALVQIGRGKANLGIDFAGGTSVQIKFEGGMPGLQEIRDALEGAGLKEFDLQDLPTENGVLIRVKKAEEELGGYSDLIVKTLNQKFSANKPAYSTTQIGPKVGEKLRSDALFAIFAATIGILIYVAFRFQFRFSVGATAATFHDVLAVLGIFNIMGKEINLILVSALLMIAGYSLTDTVVIFDRIRENLKGRVKGEVNTVINKSINEVLSRTIIVSLTTLLAAVALYLFGGDVIHDFSVFVASPVVLLWKSKKPLMGR
jgi:preprotein translocase subunit SecF